MFYCLYPKIGYDRQLKRSKKKKNTTMKKWNGKNFVRLPVTNLNYTQWKRSFSSMAHANAQIHISKERATTTKSNKNKQFHKMKQLFEISISTCKMDLAHTIFTTKHMHYFNLKTKTTQFWREKKINVENWNIHYVLYSFVIYVYFLVLIFFKTMEHTFIV